MHYDEEREKHHSELDRRQRNTTQKQAKAIVKEAVQRSTDRLIMSIENTIMNAAAMGHSKYEIQIKELIGLKPRIREETLKAVTYYLRKGGFKITNGKELYTVKW